MTNTELISKIKAEIERHINELDISDESILIEAELSELISFLSTLESEKPEADLEKEIETNIRCLNGLHTFEDNKSWYKGRYEELKELARHFAQWGAEHLADDRKMTRDVEDVAAEKAREYALSLPGGERTTSVGSTYSESGYYHGFVDGSKFKSDEKSFIENLDEAAEEWAKENYGVNYMEFDFTQDAAFRAMYHFRAGAKWDRQQMPKNAVNATVHLEPGANPIVTIGVGRFGLKVGDKVKVIVVKDL